MAEGNPVRGQGNRPIQGSGIGLGHPTSSSAHNLPNNPRSAHAASHAASLAVSQSSTNAYPPGGFLRTTQAASLRGNQQGREDNRSVVTGTSRRATPVPPTSTGTIVEVDEDSLSPPISSVRRVSLGSGAVNQHVLSENNSDNTRNVPSLSAGSPGQTGRDSPATPMPGGRSLPTSRETSGPLSPLGLTPSPSDMGEEEMEEQIMQIHLNLEIDATDPHPSVFTMFKFLIPIKDETLPMSYEKYYHNI
ncbi:hypothetical protein BDP27DRAFT_1363885 [Rhodocollybia butyracea]|uniref:Uncharacterized protein n=1 Tax=Rhodocollybia butyracea TaxID=206335 RepID=A0A9P5U6F7_9AGAR|nr:hypothetical protein BDP27DRAFT_1363885 [Rhodocollybia butyracea]